ncbi:porin family protein [Flavobacterium marginilacus]|uniref:porin family protein n=1 Tax=Flavobacterium marginilacus TaxID=3003256 RepID=UPI00248DC7C7|nr:porin family protein [Flavobacterium marginilacus]
MKKRVITIICFVLIGIVQSNAQVTFQPGVKGGVVFSRLTNFDSDFKTGFYLGGQLAIKFNKLYTLQPELVYSQQGANSNYSDLLIDNYYNQSIITVNNSVKHSLDYLSLGAISKFSFGTGFHVIVGPSLDFKVNDNFDKSYFYSDSPIGFDFAIVGGFGFSFPNGLSLDARFKQGVVDIYGNNYNTNIDNNNNGNYDEVVLNQSFQLGLSYSFDIK